MLATCAGQADRTFQRLPGASLKFCQNSPPRGAEEKFARR